MQSLVIVRHAKAARPEGVADADRPLQPRGVEDARAAGRWLREAVGCPDLTICSQARRAAETAAGLLAAFGDAAPEVTYQPAVYDATVADLLTVLADLSEGKGVVALVGHNPSVSGLVGALTGQWVDLRTCGIATVRLPSTWAPTDGAVGTLLSVVTPRAS